MQARHLFWVLLRDQVGPLLRAEGFRGSGQSWRLEHPSGNAALIRIQRSRWNTADSVQFTINLAVASKVVWDWQLTREPGRGPAARPSALYDPAPSLHPTAPSRSFTATTGRSAGAPRVGTQPLAGSARLGRSLAPPSDGRIGVRLPTFRAGAADQDHVAFMPDTIWPVSGHPPDSSRAPGEVVPVPVEVEVAVPAR
jgi:hypothetical protein